MAVYIRRERLEACQERAWKLMLEHQAERQVDVGWGPEPDLRALLGMERAGALMFWGARTNGELIGYIMWTGARTNVEYAGLATATQGPWFVTKEKRSSGAGLKLFRQSLVDLARLGYKLAEPHHWGEPRLGKMFERLGAKQTTTNYLMSLEAV